MGCFDEELLPKVSRPKMTRHMERQIGAFFVAWSVLENELDIAFAVLFRVDPTLASCLYGNLGTRAKLDIIMSGIDALSLLLGERRTRSAHKLLSNIITLNDRARNTLAHARLLPFYDDELRKPVWRMIRYSARKEHVWITHPNEVRHWKRLTNAVYAKADAWHRKMHVLYSRLKKFSDADIQKNSRVREKEAMPIVFRRTGSNLNANRAASSRAAVS
jgi:hypothetical protein